MTKFKHDRQYDEMERVASDVIEAVGHERLLEHILCEMDPKDRQELGLELNDTLFPDLRESDRRDAVLESIMNRLDEWYQNVQSEDSIKEFNQFKLKLIWSISEVGLDGR